MVDVLPILARWLKPLGRVELQFPAGKPKLPLITISDLGSASSLILDGRERLCSVEFQLDIWAGSPKECAGLAEQANRVILAKGFERYFGASLPDPAAPARKCLRYRGEIDEKTNLVHRR